MTAYKVGDRVEVNSNCMNSSWVGATGVIKTAGFDILEVTLDAPLKGWNTRTLSMRSRKFNIIDDATAFVPEDWS